MSEGRWWVYPRGEWSGRLPSIGNDEWGRRTIVLPIPLGPTIVWAFWTCWCEDCVAIRWQTARWDWACEVYGDIDDIPDEVVRSL